MLDLKKDLGTQCSLIEVHRVLSINLRNTSKNAKAHLKFLTRTVELLEKRKAVLGLKAVS